MLPKSLFLFWEQHRRRHKRTMQAQVTATPPKEGGVLSWLVTNVGRIAISLIVPVVTFLVLWQGFIFLRDSNAPRIVIVLVAIIWGVGGVAILYTVSNWLIEKLPRNWAARLQPFVF